MKKALIVFVFVAVVIGVVAQEYKARAPKAIETRRVAGISEYLQDGPRYGIFQAVPTPEQIITNSDTNSIVILQSTSALTNSFLQMQNPTNRTRYAIKVVAKGNITVVLTTSNITAANSVGPGFDSLTNLQAATWIIPTNSTADVICTGTNYLVVPGSK